MQRSSKFISFLQKFKKDLIAIVIIATILKIAYTAALVFLPKKSIEFMEKKDRANYYLFNLPRSLAISKEEIAKEKKVVEEKKSEYSLKELTLKAIYSDEDDGGFVLVLDKVAKSHLISKGEVFQGYELTKIEKRKATFTKNSKLYILEILDNSKVRIAPKTENSPVRTVSISTVQTKDRVSREEINKYKNNLNLIWRDIKIQPNYSGGKIRGFNVEYVKRGSVFEKLGLQAGDRIIRGNGMELTSVKDALTLYKQIDKIKVFKLGIIRNSNEVELEYEVY